MTNVEKIKREEVAERLTAIRTELIALEEVAFNDIDDDGDLERMIAAARVAVAGARRVAVHGTFAKARAADREAS